MQFFFKNVGAIKHVRSFKEYIRPQIHKPVKLEPRTHIYGHGAVGNFIKQRDEHSKVMPVPLCMKSIVASPESLGGRPLSLLNDMRRPDFRHSVTGRLGPIRSITTINGPEATVTDGSATSPDITMPPRIKFKRPDKTAKNIMQILDKEAVEEVRKEREIPDIRPGYIIQMKVVVPENKRRVSVLKAIVIARRNAGLNSTFRVRRLVAGVGVEAVYPLYSPNIMEIKVLDKKKVRRAKLYYLRDKINPLKK
ncbi:hypothetical protein AMTRI_Chr13g115780 [Amborella trichopoda]